MLIKTHSKTSQRNISGFSIQTPLTYIFMFSASLLTLSPEILLLYQPQVFTWWNVTVANTVMVRFQCKKATPEWKAAKKTRPSASKEGDSAFIIRLTVSQAVGIGRILEHVGYKPHHRGEVPSLSLLAGVIPSCSNIYRDRESITLSTVPIFLNNFFWLWK